MSLSAINSCFEYILRISKHLPSWACVSVLHLVLVNLHCYTDGYIYLLCLLQELHRIAISGLAELTSKCIEQFHKSGELILLQKSEVSDFVNISQVLLRYNIYIFLTLQFLCHSRLASSMYPVMTDCLEGWFIFVESHYEAVILTTVVLCILKAYLNFKCIHISASSDGPSFLTVSCLQTSRVEQLLRSLPELMSSSYIVKNS